MQNFLQRDAEIDWAKNLPRHDADVGLHFFPVTRNREEYTDFPN